MIEKILAYILACCDKEDFDKTSVALISENLKISRSQVSVVLNKLVKENKLIRIESKPFCFISVEYLKEKSIPFKDSVYASLDDLLSNQEKKDFEKLVGMNHSLTQTVKQCKATISYPPNGLPMLLYGPAGTGKSLIAKLTYEWAKNQGVISKDGQFVQVNCSEYANNPELLTANLFGHVKGAFTGAEKDNEGLIALADNGVLFLDEVHELKAECQEKLFLFMDQGIYHRVGDNVKWYKSNVRIVFATTENPDKVLLKTLMRRIPMTITIPSLEQRGTQERIELLYDIFSREEKRLDCQIKMSSKVYNALLQSKMPGNIGQLKSSVQSCCINSLFDKVNDELVIHLDSLPKDLLQQVYANQKTVLDDDEYIYVDDLQGYYNGTKEILQLNDSLLACYRKYKEEHTSLSDFMAKEKNYVQKYFDNLIFRKKESSQVDYYNRGVQHIFNLIESRYGLKITNNETLAIASYLDEIHHEYHDLRSWFLKHEEECDDLYQLLQEEFFRATNVSLEICTYLKSYLEMDMYSIIICTFIFYVYNVQKDSRLSQKAAVVLSHGFSTASSIADAANRFLGQYIFDALDMPLYIDTATMIEKLNRYLDRIGKVKELYLLVDMGSLEDIYKGLHIENANIGIINNVSTPIALEIGNGIRNNVEMESILQKTIDAFRVNFAYHIEKHQQKQPVILCSCASGLGTAKKLKSMLEQSFPDGINLDVKTLNYSELIELGKKNNVFEEYDVLCVLGTLDPNMEDIPFVGIEDLIIEDTFGDFNQYFKDYMDEEQLSLFDKNILHNFSLSNIMNALTILNPAKLLEQVANAIDVLQKYVGVRFSNRTCFGLYVHICCLIERLVVSRNAEYDPSLDFLNEHKDFVAYVKKAFKQVDDFYGVDIPTEEMIHIYNYVKNNL